MDIYKFEKTGKSYKIEYVEGGTSYKIEVTDRIPHEDLLNKFDELTIPAQIICGIENPTKLAENKIIPDKTISLKGYELKATDSGDEIYLNISKKFKNGSLSIKLPKILKEANLYEVENEIHSIVTELEEEIKLFVKEEKQESTEQKLPFADDNEKK